jgi:hypothetical protein
MRQGDDGATIQTGPPRGQVGSENYTLPSARIQSSGSFNSYFLSVRAFHGRKLARYGACDREKALLRRSRARKGEAMERLLRFVGLAIVSVIAVMMPATRAAGADVLSLDCDVWQVWVDFDSATVITRYKGGEAKPTSAHAQISPNVISWTREGNGISITWVLDRMAGTLAGHFSNGKSLDTVSCEKGTTPPPRARF